MRISVIITTYKRPIAVLKRAIDSVINQTYTFYELIVVNDFPKDKDLSRKINELISSYDDDRIRYISYKQNKGACFARNFGILHAIGECVAFLDDDDEWLSEKLITQVRCMKKNDADMVFNPTIETYASGAIRIINKEYKEGVVPDIFKRLLVSNCIGSTSLPLIRKDILIECGMFDERLGSSQDLDMWIRIARSGKIAFDPNPAMNYSVSDDSITKSLSKAIQAFEYVNEKYKEYFENDSEIYNRRLNNMCCSCIGYYHDLKTGLKYWIRAIKVKPISKNNFMVFKKFFDKICAKDKIL